MSLSIYSIKHPLVINWTSSIIYSKVSSRHKFQFLNNIGLALIYEATRKSLKNINLSIKSIDKYKSISILPQQLSYFILIDISLYQVLNSDINTILPSTTIYPMYKMNSYARDTVRKTDQGIGKILSNSKFKNLIILIKHLDTDYSTQILYLFEVNNCIYDKIQICCVTCSATALQTLNTKKYNINLYTAKILEIP